MALLDSDFLIAILRGESDAATTLKRIEAEQPIGTTVINVYELLVGAQLHSRPEEKRQEAESLLQSLVVSSMTPAAASCAATISALLIKKGEKIDFQDIAIASIAIANNETLYTRNVKHFSRITGLAFKEW